MKDLEKVLSSLAATKKVHPSNFDSPRFVASVTSVSNDRSTIRIKLCTGAFLDVPTAVLKNPIYLGTASHQNERWGLGSGEIDVSTGTGMLIQQMAHEITRLCRLSHSSRERSSRVQGTETNSLSAQTEQPPGEKKKSKLPPFDTELPPQSIKLSFDGVAGTPVTIRYTTPPTQYYRRALCRSPHMERGCPLQLFFYDQRLPVKFRVYDL